MLRSPTKNQRRQPTAVQIETDKQFLHRLAMLVMMWANAESWLHRVLAVLLRINPSLASLVLTSFTSTRARTELIERAAVMCLPDARRVRHLKRLIADFRSVTKMRNDLCHSQYDLDPTETVLTGLFATNFQRQDFDGTNFGNHRRIDRGFLNEIAQAHRKAVSLCSRFERFVKRAPPFVLEQPRATPLLLLKRRRAKLPQSRRSNQLKRKRPQRPSGA